MIYTSYYLCILLFNQSSRSPNYDIKIVANSKSCGNILLAHISMEIKHQQSIDFLATFIRWESCNLKSHYVFMSWKHWTKWPMI